MGENVYILSKDFQAVGRDVQRERLIKSDSYKHFTRGEVLL